MFDSPGLFGDFLPNHHMLDNSSGHVAEHFKIEFESTTQNLLDEVCWS